MHVYLYVCLVAHIYLGWVPTFRLLVIGLYYDYVASKIMGKEPYWYLHLLCVDPDSQGKGKYLCDAFMVVCSHIVRVLCARHM